MTPSQSKRIGIALLIGAAAGFFTWLNLHMQSPSSIANDFTWHWRAARALLDGQSPYDVIKATGAYPFNAGYKYPLTATVIVLPLGYFSPRIAAGLFIGVSSALLAFGLTRHDYRKLPMFLSVPFIWSCYLGQTSPLMCAAMVLPAVSGLFVVKPNLGLGVLVYRARMRPALIGAVLVLALAFIFDPLWPIHWVRTLAERQVGLYATPVTLMGGPLLLLALMRWRQPEARLLLAMSIVPQTFFFYDQLPLWLVARTRLETMVLSLLSAAELGAVWLLIPRGLGAPETTKTTSLLALAFCYLPCLVMVMRRANQPEESVS